MSIFCLPRAAKQPIVELQSKIARIEQTNDLRKITNADIEFLQSKREQLLEIFKDNSQIGLSFSVDHLSLGKRTRELIEIGEFAIKDVEIEKTCFDIQAEIAQTFPLILKKDCRKKMQELKQRCKALNPHFDAFKKVHKETLEKIALLQFAIILKHFPKTLGKDEIERLTRITESFFKKKVNKKQSEGVRVVTGQLLQRKLTLQYHEATYWNPLTSAVCIEILQNKAMSIATRRLNGANNAVRRMRIGDLAFVLRTPMDKTKTTRFQEEELLKTQLAGHPNIHAPVLVRRTDPKSFSSVALYSARGIPQRGDTPFTLIAKQLFSALGYMHAHGVIHRDIKLENVLIFPDYHIEITDFEMAETTIPATNTELKGTRGYLSPETWSTGTTITGAVDIFATGILLFELLTKANIHDMEFRPMNFAREGASDTSKFQRKYVIPEINAKPKSPLWRLVYQCVMPDPEDRPSAKEALNMIDPVPKRRRNKKGFEMFSKKDKEAALEPNWDTEKETTNSSSPAGGAGAAT